MLHTDQGSQFTADMLIERVLSKGIRLSLDGKGRAEGTPEAVYHEAKPVARTISAFPTKNSFYGQAAFRLPPKFFQGKS